MDLSFLLEFAFVKYYSVWQDHLHNAPAWSFSSLHLPALKKKKNEICNEWNFQSDSDFLPGRKLLSVRTFFPFLFRSQISSGYQSRGFKNMFLKKGFKLDIYLNNIEFGFFALFRIQEWCGLISAFIV